MLVMVVGLLLALLASHLIHWSDRGRFARQINIDHYVERVAAAVRLLDEGDVGRRADLLKVMQTPLFRVRQIEGHPHSRDLDVAETPLSREVEKRLRARLEREQVIFRVVVSAQREKWSLRSSVHAGMHETRTGFLAVLELRDGTALRFTSRMPGEAGGWPLRLVISMGILLLTAGLLATLAVRFVTSPLHTVTRQAEKIGLDLETPEIPETGPVEVRGMSMAMNTMQRKIRDLFAQRMRFLASVSHDLRTPITRLRLRAESIEDAELRFKVARDLEEMERMVQETLEFMRDGVNQEPLRKVELNALIEALVEDMAEQGQRVEFEPVTRKVINARPLALKRCVGNLLSNAIRYGQDVEIRLLAGPHGARIQVLDNGPGIPDAELKHVFEPFYRSDKARGDGGTGLGLSIARSIAESLGGELNLRNRETGGLEANIDLPDSSV